MTFLNFNFRLGVAGAVLCLCRLNGLLLSACDPVADDLWSFLCRDPVTVVGAISMCELKSIVGNGAEPEI